MKKQPINAIICAMAIALASCAGRVPGKPDAKTPAAGSAQADSTAISKEALTNIYCQAISDYITEAYNMNGAVFDTLFIGKRKNNQPDDFPDISLPDTIKNTKIRLTDPETGKKLQEAKPSRVYINLIGWVDQNNAEFIFVTFSNGFEHQFDCYLDYKFNAGRTTYDLVKSRMEKFKQD